MVKQEMNLIIDAGNTRVKVVEIQGDEVLRVDNYSILDFRTGKVQKSRGAIRKSLLSSVLSKTDTELLVDFFQPMIVLDATTKLPFLNGYKSKTLGADRMANAAFAHFEALKLDTAILVIDIGTCLKFDFVNEHGEYMGGSISPGLQMRYKSMHHFTGRLPLLDNTEEIKLVGKTTEESMRSGVMNGMRAEILGLIQEYQKQYRGLTTFMTGGDAKLFDIEAKNYIFVNENLTLKGLNLILEHNAK